MATDTQATPFTPAEREALAALAGLIIPASESHGLPGADDPQILATILADAARHRQALTGPLAEFAGIGAASPGERGAEFRRTCPAAARLIQTLVAQGYYRDDRVMRSLAMDARAPFPAGYEVRQGDWSLLDPVRGRAPLYRPTE